MTALSYYLVVVTVLTISYVCELMKTNLQTVGASNHMNETRRISMRSHGYWCVVCYVEL